MASFISLSSPAVSWSSAANRWLSSDHDSTKELWGFAGMKYHLTERGQVMKTQSERSYRLVIVSMFLMVVSWSEASTSLSTTSLLSASNRKGFNPDGGYDAFGEAPAGFEHINRLYIFRNSGKRKSRFQSSLESFNRATEKSV